MIKDMIVSSSALETRVAILEDDQLAELYIERHRHRGIVANIYKGKVTKVLPGMQSAFVCIGLEKDAFLYVSDFVEENEDCDQVFPAVEEQLDTIMMEAAEDQERPSRRERRNERGRWKGKKEKPDTVKTAAGNAAADEGKSESPLEQWDISTETEREAEAFLESNGARALSYIEEIQVPSPDVSATGGSISAPTVWPSGPETGTEGMASAGFETNTEAPHRPEGNQAADTARIRDDGETFPFTAEDAAKTGLTRRRGAAVRRKRHTAARHTQRSEIQSIDDMLREGQEILVQVAKEP
ncbi:MAG TPA: hypothetical protein VLL97_12010, partial [Acidobacteriota bacterium]|nr:hypothetical protein [Acidobacteriota bacterium]